MWQRTGAGGESRNSNSRAGGLEINLKPDGIGILSAERWSAVPALHPRLLWAQTFNRRNGRGLRPTSAAYRFLKQNNGNSQNN
jgi:hypothetical protein